ncbi:MAG: pseudouridine-5'-phosphate glycosidase [Eubacteriaceae bacterium]|nr:pseudouridine-5'-phosphate glycosidase [Eubacteriaceae bacterium]
MNSENFVLKREVAEAVRENRAVVALESTIISHGMPYPQNVETALRVEEAIRECGAVPATIAAIGGVIRVGLSPEEIEYIGKRGPEAVKCSRRDLPFVVGKKLDGAMTVASTMICAKRAGIKVFATGGIGGVHRGAETTMDISADLDELARTDVTVVCAGVKSILDIGLTLEYLETKGVAVLCYGTDTMPAFYTAKSPYAAPFRVDTVEEIASFMKARDELELGCGTVVANPVPDEYSMPEDVINAAIEQALREASEAGIKGKATTPFLLARIKDITGGDSLESNIQLVLNNARLASRIALEYVKNS